MQELVGTNEGQHQSPAEHSKAQVELPIDGSSDAEIQSPNGDKTTASSPQREFRSDSPDGATLTEKDNPPEPTPAEEEFLDAMEQQPPRSERPLYRLGSTLGKVMTGVRDHRDKEGKEGSDRQLYIVGFQNANDPQNPQNWSHVSRWLYT